MINGVRTKAGEIYEQVYGEQLHPDKGFRGDPYTNNRANGSRCTTDPGRSWVP